jgi:hypothetical protein
MTNRATRIPLNVPQAQGGTQTIALSPLDESHWMVEVSGVQNAQLFMDSRLAEAAARRLAEALADAGQNTRLKVYLPDGNLRGQFVAVHA